MSGKDYYKLLQYSLSMHLDSHKELSSCVFIHCRNEFIKVTIDIMVYIHTYIRILNGQPTLDSVNKFVQTLMEVEAIYIFMSERLDKI